MAIRKKRLQVVLSESEYEKLQRCAEGKKMAMSEIIRDYIKSLQ